MSTDPAPYIVHPAERIGSAFRVTGPRYWVEFQASSALDGRIHVDVVQRRPGEQGARLTYSEDGSFVFLPDEITIEDACLSCHTTWPSYLPEFDTPYFRKGFVLDLDAGMADGLRSALKTVQLIAQACRLFGSRLDELLDERGMSSGDYTWMRDAVCDAGVYVLLDEMDPKDAVDAAFRRYTESPSWGSKPEAFKAATLQVIQELVLNMLIEEEAERTQFKD